VIRHFGDLAAYLDLISRRAALQVPFRFEISREAGSHARRDPLRNPFSSIGGSASLSPSFRTP